MELFAPVPRGSDAVQAPETITTRGIPERTATLFQLPCYDNCVSGSKDVLLDVLSVFQLSVYLLFLDFSYISVLPFSMVRSCYILDILYILDIPISENR